MRNARRIALPPAHRHLLAATTTLQASTSVLHSPDYKLLSSAPGPLWLARLTSQDDAGAALASRIALFRSTVHGSILMAHGLRLTDHGSRITDHESRLTVSLPGLTITDNGSQLAVPRPHGSQLPAPAPIPARLLPAPAHWRLVVATTATTLPAATPPASAPRPLAATLPHAPPPGARAGSGARTLSNR